MATTLLTSVKLTRAPSASRTHGLFRKPCLYGGGKASGMKCVMSKGFRYIYTLHNQDFVGVPLDQQGGKGRKR